MVYTSNLDDLYVLQLNFLDISKICLMITGHHRADVNFGGESKETNWVPRSPIEPAFSNFPAFTVQELLHKIINTITLGKHEVPLDPDKCCAYWHPLWIFSSFYLIHFMKILF